MATLTALSADDVATAMFAFRDGLTRHQAVINRLNVYPVPDGDTGTNMALTLEAVAAELEGLDRPARHGRRLQGGGPRLADGGAGELRGDPLPALAGGGRTVHPSVAVGPDEVAEALAAAGDLAYQAVVRPVEGTILTVARAAGEGAESARRRGRGSPGGAGSGAPRAPPRRSSARPTSWRRWPEREWSTPAGPATSCCSTHCCSWPTGRPLPQPPDVAPAQAMPAGSVHGNGDAVGDLRYEVMYLLKRPTTPSVTSRRCGRGSVTPSSSSAATGCGTATSTPTTSGRPSRRASTPAGRVRSGSRTSRSRWTRSGGSAREWVSPSTSPPDPPPTTGIVAVVSGEGIGRIFRSLGVHHQVRGGQSMNPSTADILEAVETLGSDQVIVLPNNKNICPVAEQVDALTKKRVRVVPTGSIVEGFSALLAYDPGAEVEVNEKAMRGVGRAGCCRPR